LGKGDNISAHCIIEGFTKYLSLFMQAPKSLRRPSNWQDFETLCKKLWGEIWQCAEIKKNGRAGQLQDGVDIYGQPSGQQGYIGIQCKGKVEYNDKQFTESEIIKEIDKAKNFKPKLRKLYFATTALKDARIEEFVREKNIENQVAGLFEVHLYSWEDIVELIDENKHTSDWYINNQNYKANHAASLFFENGEKEITLKPKFKQHKTLYQKEFKLPSFPEGFPNLEYINRIQQSFNAINAFVIRPSFQTISTNLSMVAVRLKLHNSGTEALEDYKVNLTFEGEIIELSKRNAERRPLEIIPKSYQPTSFVYNNVKEVTLSPRKNILVHGDVFSAETFYIKPDPNCQKIIIHYTLLSRNFKDEGSLIIEVQPDIQFTYKTITVTNEEEEKNEYGEIEDYIEISE
jgi:hypothetical protein